MLTTKIFKITGDKFEIKTLEILFYYIEQLKKEHKTEYIKIKIDGNDGNFSINEKNVITNEDIDQFIKKHCTL